MPLDKCLASCANVASESGLGSQCHESDTNFIVTLTMARCDKHPREYRLYFYGASSGCGQELEIASCEGNAEKSTLLSWDSWCFVTMVLVARGQL